MRNRRISTRVGVAAAAGMLALTVAGPAAAQDEAITQIGYASPETATDLGWNEQGLIAATAAAEGAGATVIEADGAGWDDVLPTLNSLKDDGAQFIVSHASAFGASTVAWAGENGIPVLVWEQPGAIEAGLIGDAETQAQDGGYLAGVLAATMTGTGTLGVVVSATGDPNWQKQAGGFVQGAFDTDPSVQVVRTTIGPGEYGNEPGGNQATQQVIAAGADIVFGMGNGSSFGMLAAVDQNTAPGSDKTWFIDVIGDKSQSEWSDVLLSSVLWDFQVAFDQALADLAAGTYGESVYVLDGANGGMRILDTPNITDEGRAAIEAAAAGIADGSVTIPSTPTEEEVTALQDSLAAG